MRNKNIFLIISLLALILSIIVFMICFHNIDVCQNLWHIQDEGNKIFKQYKLPIQWNFVENDIFFNKWNLQKCYIINIRYSLYSFLSVIIFSFLVGYNIRRIK